MTVWLEIIAFHPLPVVGTTPWLCSPRFHSIMHPPLSPFVSLPGPPTPKPRRHFSCYYFPACGLSSAFLIREKPPSSVAFVTTAISGKAAGIMNCFVIEIVRLINLEPVSDYALEIENYELKIRIKPVRDHFNFNPF